MLLVGSTHAQGMGDAWGDAAPFPWERSGSHLRAWVAETKAKGTALEMRMHLLTWLFARWLTTCRLRGSGTDLGC